MKDVVGDPAAVVERHRDTLEALAASDLDLQLCEDAKTLLEQTERGNQ